MARHDDGEGIAAERLADALGEGGVAERPGDRAIGGGFARRNGAGQRIDPTFEIAGPVEIEPGG